jgi:hypothetical protein
MLAIFLPYLLVVFILSTKIRKKEILVIILLILPSIVAFLVSIYYSGTTSQVADIFDSIEKEGYVIYGGAIASLGRSASHGLEAVVKGINNGHYLFYYLQVLALSIIAYIPLKNNLNYVFKKNISKLLISISVAGSILLFIVAIDWGRFIYIHLVSLFLLSFLATNKWNNREYLNITLSYLKAGKGRKYIMLAFLLFYSQFWYMPHCCSSNPYISKYTYININALNFAKPYVKIALKVFKK